MTEPATPASSGALATLARGIAAPTTWAELMQLSDYVAKSDLVPKDFRDKPANCAIAIQMGAEVGLSWANALQSIAVINGRPSIWGDAALALVMAHPAFESIDENECADAKGVCVLKRRGMPERRYEFTLEMARTAGLLNKDTYKQHQGRMLQRRARARAMADLFPDALKGLALADDAPAEIVINPVATPADTEPKAAVSGAERVRKKMTERKPPQSAEPSQVLKDMLRGYAEANSPDDIRDVDQMGKHLKTEEERAKAREARTTRLDQLIQDVDPETGEVLPKRAEA